MSASYMVVAVTPGRDGELSGQPAIVFGRYTERPTDDYLQRVAASFPERRVYCLLGADFWHEAGSGKPIAFLAGNLSAGRHEVSTGYRIASTKGDDRGHVLLGEKLVPFRIITRADQLRGLELSDVIELPSFDDQRLCDRVEIREIAATRVR